MSRLSRPYERAVEALHLPPMQGNLLRFHEEVQADAPSLETLTALALADPGLCARLLAAASAPPFHRDGPLRSLRDGLAALGTPVLRTIAGCLLVQTALPHPGGAPAVALAGFWRHSLAVAELSRDIAFALDIDGIELEEAYLAGLLHDVGELLLLGGFGARYAALLSEARDERDLAARENALFETDHAQVGAWLVDQWALPSAMADAIASHHLEAEETAGLDTLGRILWSAHALLPAGRVDDDAAETAGRLLGLAPERLRTLAAQAEALGAARVDESAAPADPDAPPWPLPLAAAAPAPAGATRLQTALLVPAALQSLTHDVPAASGEAILLHGLAEAARLLFGSRRPVFLLREADTLAISPADASPPALRRLRIPLGNTACLCADAARDRRLIATHDHQLAAKLPPIDRQILHAIGAEGLVYVPMIAGGVVLGVLALGVSPVQLKLLEGHSERLQEFATAAARRLDDWRGLRERERRAASEAAARFTLQGQRLAHEVGNPLAIIRNHLTLLAADALQEAPERVQADLAVLREEIERLGGIVRDFAAARPAGTAPADRSDLNVMLEGLRRLYGHTLFEQAGMRLELRPSREPAWIGVDADAVKQVVFNLWKNAAQAMGDAGSVVTEVEAPVDHNGARYVQLRIRDSGPGLPASVRESLYQPRAPGADIGTRVGERAGLGLSIVLSLVQRIGGAITCVSRPDEGTAFTVLIPAS